MPALPGILALHRNQTVMRKLWCCGTWMIELYRHEIMTIVSYATSKQLHSTITSESHPTTMYLAIHLCCSTRQFEHVYLNTCTPYTPCHEPHPPYACTPASLLATTQDFSMIFIYPRWCTMHFVKMTYTIWGSSQGELLDLGPHNLREFVYSRHPDPRRVWKGVSEQHLLTPLPGAPGAPGANSKKLYLVVFCDDFGTFARHIFTKNVYVVSLQ